MRAFLGSPALARVAQALPFQALDVGARNGFTGDLLPLAPAVDAVGFEPEAQECARLNASAGGQGPWRSLRFVPAALGEEGTRALHLYRRRGCSSLLQADQALAAQFSRGDYFALEDVAKVRTVPLDQAAREYGFEDAAYLKIDIQGAELEVFRTGPRLLSRLLAIRCEVSFLPVYRGQPLFHEVDAHLRAAGFAPMEFRELHHWRRSTKVKHPRLAPGDLPYSRGQLAHGDVLYFRDPATMPDRSTGDLGRLVRRALLAAAHGHVDDAEAILRRPAVADHLRSAHGLDAAAELSVVSRTLAWRHRIGGLRGLFRGGPPWP